MAPVTISSEGELLLSFLKDDLHPFLDATVYYNPAEQAWDIEASLTIRVGVRALKEGLNGSHIRGLAQALNNSMKKSLSKEMLKQLHENHKEKNNA